MHGKDRGLCQNILLRTLGRSMRQGYVLAFAPPHGMSRMPACQSGTAIRSWSEGSAPDLHALQRKLSIVASHVLKELATFRPAWHLS